MNEKRIQQILAVEKEAQAIYDAAAKQAEQLPRQAEAEVQSMIEKARQEAEEEARKIIAQAKVDEESDRILAQSDERLQHSEKMAKVNFDRAVAYTLARILGTEMI